MGARRRARERVLQVLYAFHVGEVRWEGSGLDLSDLLADVASRFPLHGPSGPLDAAQKPPPEEDHAYARALLHGILTRLADLDQAVTRAGPRWRIDRMDPVDLGVIRIGVFELLFEDDVPAAVTINEAVELARTYGSEHSSAFVNGVLDRIRKDLAVDSA
jgi:N utilization substance protein B